MTHRIAKSKEPHTIAEEHTLPAALDMVTLMTGESAVFSALALMKSYVLREIQCGEGNSQFTSTI